MRLSLHNTLCKLNFKDLLDCHRILQDFKESFSRLQLNP